MLTLAKVAILGVVAAGILSLLFGFSLSSGFKPSPTPRPNVIHETIVVQRPQHRSWPKTDPGSEPQPIKKAPHAGLKDFLLP